MQIDKQEIFQLISKILKVSPETLGQASRIGGVRPSDIAVLSLYLKTHI